MYNDTNYQPIIRSNYRFPIYTESNPFWWSSIETRIYEQYHCRFRYSSFVRQLLDRASSLEVEANDNNTTDEDRKLQLFVLAEKLRNTASEML